MLVLYRSYLRYFSKTEGKFYVPLVTANVKGRHLHRHFPCAGEAVNYANRVIARYNRLFGSTERSSP